MEETSNSVKPALSNIRDEWHWVKGGIEEILSLDPNLTYRPEDIYASVLAGNSHLWTHPDFFVVTTIEHDVFNNQNTLLIWLSWSVARGKGNAAQHFKFFEDAAKQCGCHHIQVRTPHKRVGDYIEQELGWPCIDRIYGKDLEV